MDPSWNEERKKAIISIENAKNEIIGLKKHPKKQEAISMQINSNVGNKTK